MGRVGGRDWQKNVKEGQGQHTRRVWCAGQALKGERETGGRGWLERGRGLPLAAKANHHPLPDDGPLRACHGAWRRLLARAMMRTLCRSKPLVPAGDAGPSCPPPSLSPAPPTAVSGEPLRAVGSEKAGLGRIACRQALAARARMRGTVEARYLAALQGAPLATTSAATKKARRNNLLPLCERPRPGSGALIASPRGLKIGLYLARCWPPQQRTQQQSSQE